MSEEDVKPIVLVSPIKSSINIRHVAILLMWMSGIVFVASIMFMKISFLFLGIAGLSLVSIAIFLQGVILLVLSKNMESLERILNAIERDKAEG